MSIKPETEELLAQKRFELVNGESLIIEGLSTYLKSAFTTMPCHAVLTNHRIVICKKGLTGPGAQTVFGLVGVAASYARKQTKITFQIPVIEIAGIKKKKHKYCFTTHSGETFNLQFRGRERWEDQLKLLGIIINE